MDFLTCIIENGIIGALKYGFDTMIKISTRLQIVFHIFACGICLLSCPLFNIAGWIFIIFGMKTLGIANIIISIIAIIIPYYQTVKYAYFYNDYYDDEDDDNE